MRYKVLIPAAGTGSRLGGITKYLNKSLVSIANKPALTRIIEMFPSDTEFVIAVGYKGELVKEFIELAYPDRKIDTVDVFPYEGEGSGLGLSIQLCKEYLQEPFVFCSCDTLVNESIPEPDRNWMGYDIRDNKEQYRTISVNKNCEVECINEKGVFHGSEIYPYIGLAGIHDYKTFWKIMEEGGNTAVLQGESYGLKGLVEQVKIYAEKFTWFDTGVKVELEATRNRYKNMNDPNILEKANEAIWFLDNKVIKFSDDANFISDRITRAELLKNYVPQITAFTKHMYCYEYVHGDVMSRYDTLPIFKKMLDFSKLFWKEVSLNEDERKKFETTCLAFYKDKTFKRVNLFYNNFQKKDNAIRINGICYPTLAELFEKVDWEYVSNGLPGQFHGDYHFENILYDEKTGDFKFIDWRQNFGIGLETGDIYYDLAKLLHGLIVSHELIAKEDFMIKWDDEKIEYDFYRKQRLVECETYYYKWLKENEYDLYKVKLLTSLIFLNISALHEYPYSLLLYVLGKEMLANVLQEGKQNE